MDGGATGKNNLLLAGLPGVGKTTILRKVAAELRDGSVGGFVTDEIREGDQRVGFRIETFDGKQGLLAHLRIASRHRVGRYRVDLEALESVVDRAMRMDPRYCVYIVDEIGRMECFSGKFVSAVKALLDSTRIVVASVAREGGGFVEQVKRRHDVELWEVNRGNRNEMPKGVLDWVKGRLATGRIP